MDEPKFEDEDLIALMRGCAEKPMDLAPRLVLADYLEEHGRPVDANQWRRCPFLSTAEDARLNFKYGCGDGVESGYGDGDGYGSGDGSGYEYGYGDGYGDRFGDGDGYGNGSGDGDGLGDGDGDGDVDNEDHTTNTLMPQGEIMIGLQMLIFCGRGFAWLGKVEEMYTPGAYKLTNAGMLVRTGGTAWTVLAAGSGRESMVYRRAPQGIVFTGHEIHGAILWEGDLPSGDVG